MVTKDTSRHRIALKSQEPEVRIKGLTKLPVRPMLIRTWHMTIMILESLFHHLKDRPLLAAYLEGVHRHAFRPLWCQRSLFQVNLHAPVAAAECKARPFESIYTRLIVA